MPGSSEASGIASPISKRAACPSCSKMSCSSTVSTSGPGGVGTPGASGAGGSGLCSSGAGASMVTPSFLSSATFSTSFFVVVYENAAHSLTWATFYSKSAVPLKDISREISLEMNVKKCYHKIRGVIR
jgi:hypothetical protein